MSSLENELKEKDANKLIDSARKWFEELVQPNQFAVDEVLTLERLKVDPSIELGQRERLKGLRERRKKERVSELLARLESAAKGTQNLMPLFIECVENDVTLGEICNTLRAYGVSTWRRGFEDKILSEAL